MSNKQSKKTKNKDQEPVTSESLRSMAENLIVMASMLDQGCLTQKQAFISADQPKDDHIHVEINLLFKENGTDFDPAKMSGAPVKDEPSRIVLLN